MNQLAEPLTVETERKPPAEWSVILDQFSDANFYQTCAYETVRSGAGNVSHVLVKDGARIVGAAQARIAKIPGLRAGVAYIRWGPLWQPRGGAADDREFRQVIRALRHEYVRRRGLVLRVNSQLVDGEGQGFRKIFEEEGFVQNPRSAPYRTILMDIRPELEELNRGFHQKWRNCLNGARKQNHEIVEGEQEDLIRAFEPIYIELQDRKQFVSHAEFHHLVATQKELAAGEKLRIVLCKLEGEVCAGGICSATGATGIYLFGATSQRGLKSHGSYLVQWRLLEWLKQRGCHWYNLNGINPATNEGTYRFKSRLAGVHGRDVHFSGQFDAFPTAAARLVARLAEYAKARLAGFRGARGSTGKSAPAEDGSGAGAAAALC